MFESHNEKCNVCANGVQKHATKIRMFFEINKKYHKISPIPNILCIFAGKF